MESVYLRSRREFLVQNQNRDGGWGYFPGKQSWLEPTAYAILALHGEPAARKALDLALSWQNADGSFRPAGAVATPSWTTALGVTLASLAGNTGAAARGVDYLLQTHGTEADDWLAKVISKVLPQVALDHDPSLLAWPWHPNATSWIEPTAHTIVALKVAAAHNINRPSLQQRVDLGQRMILSLRCKDGGWNYGSRSALTVELPSYPETTAVALLGLAGRGDVSSPVEYGRKLASTPQAPLASAWLRISLGLHGAKLLEDPNQAVAGHVHPLLAKDAGVLRRAGHTEAVVDLLKMAGMQPVGCLIEILSPSGRGMANHVELQALSVDYKIPIICIDEIIRHRRLRERLLTRQVETRMPTKYGDATLQYMIKNHVVTNGKTSQIRTKFISCASHSWIISEFLELVEEFLEK